MACSLLFYQQLVLTTDLENASLVREATFQRQVDVQCPIITGALPRLDVRLFVRMVIIYFLLFSVSHIRSSFLHIVATFKLNILAGLEENIKQSMTEEARAIRHESSEGHKITRDDLAKKIDASTAELRNEMRACAAELSKTRMDASNKQLNDAITHLLRVVADARELATQN